MFSVEITLPQPEQSIIKMSERWAKSKRARFGQYIKESERMTRGYWLSGGSLNIRSGRLKASITSVVEEDGYDLVGRVGTDVEYAAIHEFGGVINFPTRGFSITMPERPFLRPPLEAFAPQLVEWLTEDIQNWGGSVA